MATIDRFIDFECMALAKHGYKDQAQTTIEADKLLLARCACFKFPMVLSLASGRIGRNSDGASAELTPAYRLR